MSPARCTLPKHFGALRRLHVSLRPRRSRPQVRDWPETAEGLRLRVRQYRSSGGLEPRSRITSPEPSPPQHFRAYRIDRGALPSSAGVLAAG